MYLCRPDCVPQLVSHLAFPGTEAPKGQLSSDLQAAADLSRTERRIAVAADLAELYPLADKTLRAPRNGKTNEGFIRPRHDGIVLIPSPPSILDDRRKCNL